MNSTYLLSTRVDVEVNACEVCNTLLSHHPPRWYAVNRQPTIEDGIGMKGWFEVLPKDLRHRSTNITACVSTSAGTIPGETPSSSVTCIALPSPTGVVRRQPAKNQQGRYGHDEVVSLWAVSHRHLTVGVRECIVVADHVNAGAGTISKEIPSSRVVPIPLNRTIIDLGSPAVPVALGFTHKILDLNLSHSTLTLPPSPRRRRPWCLGRRTHTRLWREPRTVGLTVSHVSDGFREMGKKRRAGGSVVDSDRVNFRMTVLLDWHRGGEAYAYH
ncbi:hypothetical protein BDV96DRAFT_601390 [Lophiotrema nucula]|uniref:Uncharacterized protein n=1 Tax=Lophiotrema nucula TaxID=690887 RepID=A0A6A5Z2A3_9PLEO|nr:hypothetical protein BDV96DRAFT_601390 [Lophiotrema nucula]